MIEIKLTFINIWLEAFSNVLDCVLHLILFVPIIGIDCPRGAQIWVVSVILRHIY